MVARRMFVPGELCWLPLLTPRTPPVSTATETQAVDTPAIPPPLGSRQRSQQLRVNLSNRGQRLRRADARPSSCGLEKLVKGAACGFVRVLNLADGQLPLGHDDQGHRGMAG
jgi:hypothetical protein